MTPSYYDPAKCLVWELASPDLYVLEAIRQWGEEAKVSKAIYERRFAGLTRYHAPQTHIFDGLSFLWLVLLPELDAGGTPVGSDSPGMHFLSLTAAGMTYKWVQADVIVHKPAFSELVEKGWDWWMGEREDAVPRTLNINEERQLEALLNSI